MNHPAVEEAAQVLDQYSRELGAAFRNDPWRRVDLACAFSAGFVENPEDDPPEVALLVLRVAFLDKDFRQARQRVEELQQYTTQ